VVLPVMMTIRSPWVFICTKLTRAATDINNSKSHRQLETMIIESVERVYQIGKIFTNAGIASSDV
jgi:hypothetical protein